jgi:ketosteroid isomerase-like protein
MKIRWMALGLVLLLAAPMLGDAQRRDRRQQQQQPEPPLSTILPDDQQIENSIGQMLAAWQVGDVGLLREHYADDVAVVSGAYEPPIVGWANFAQAYVRQRDRMQAVQLDRRNTVVRTSGSVAWVTYQWQFQAMVEGAPMAAQGHTTLVLEKRSNRWLIVHNHTSVVP